MQEFSKGEMSEEDEAARSPFELNIRDNLRDYKKHLSKEAELLARQRKARSVSVD
jgi:hypothetical protein